MIEPRDRAISRGVVLAFSAWMACWVPMVLWAYGPQNFLWVCNLAQFLVLYALWRGDRLVLSSQAGTVCLVGLVWTIDFALALATGGRTASFTAYMFNPELPLLARATSVYHTALPLFLVWALRRTGYDDRGPWLQCLLGGAVVVAGWLLTEPRRNINWVHAPFGVEQTLMPTPAYVALLLVLYPLVIYFPGHYLLRWVLRRLRVAA
jgi:hypothetical protein